jgi:exportin-1
MDSIVWAFKHTMRDISELGLQICLELLQNFGKTDPSISNAFYQQFFLSLLQDILYVLTNSFHANGFKSQSLILMQMFHMVNENRIQAPLFANSAIPTQATNNKDYLLEYVSGLLHNAFPHLNKTQVSSFVIGMFDLSKDYPQFRGHLRDFLISLKVKNLLIIIIGICRRC